MFSCKNGLEYKYDFTSKKFQIAFDFLKRKDLAELPVGSIELGEGVKANVQSYTTFLWDEHRFEAHDRFFDIQYVIEGRELFGVCDRADCKKVATPYNETKDVILYEDPEYFGTVVLNAGDFIIVAPEDAHKPRAAAGPQVPVKKIVLKVPV